MRKRQHGGIVLDLIEAAAVAALVGTVVTGIYKAWEGFRHWAGAPEVAAQIAKDQTSLDAMQATMKQAQADRDTARGNVDRAEAATKKLSDAQADMDRRQQANLAAARALREEQVKLAAQTAAREADLRAKAAAKPVLMACEDERDKAKAALKQSLQARRSPTVPPQ